ncbi:MAG: UDP-N-acetylmuramoyl-tripeptide--D-alanyl-D-alanine ligase [Planctomycetales bacterium]|nr:UDP-N-acetylmuramoyl-tripeptide--D-alanyl-D-alanine ligase [Planctomycetales bacterium]
MHVSIQELARATGGRIRLADMPPRDGLHTTLGRLVIDSRLVQPGDVFWALPGQHAHGADFAHEALVRGAQGVVADRRVTPLPGCFSLEVPDAQLALWELARWHRQHLTATIVAITGSVGKTTARQMIHTVLSPSLRGIASQKNYNNHLGVPLSLLTAGFQDDYAVLEVAGSARGEIGALATLAEPDIGVMTCVADAHLGTFGGYQQVLEAKGELLAALGAHACAVLPGDDRRVRRLAAGCAAEVTWFGRSADNDLVATCVRSHQGQLGFRVQDQPFQVPVWGRHHLASALAAIAVGRLFGRSLSEIADALATFQPVPMRCEVLSCGAVTAINDTYNACPVSMKAALALLSEFANSGRRIVACGDMVDLGEAAQQLHYQLGRDVIAVGAAQRLIACGNFADAVACGAREAGMPADAVTVCRDAQEAAEKLMTTIAPGDVVLAKGSRVMHMERVVESLAQYGMARVA